MLTPQLIAILATGLMMGGFAGNELSHGAVAETMGLGHHHMTDFGGYHCAGPGDEAHWAQHVQHVHGNQTTFADHCDGHHMDADHGHVGDGMDGPMGPGRVGGSP